MGPEDGDNSNARASVRRSAQRTHCEPIAFSKFKITFTRHDVSHKTYHRPSENERAALLFAR
jgi:hypothetical protein